MHPRAGSYTSSIFSFGKNIYPGFYSIWTNLHSYQQWISTLPFPQITIIIVVLLLVHLFSEICPGCPQTQNKLHNSANLWLLLLFVLFPSIFLLRLLWAGFFFLISALVSLLLACRKATGFCVLVLCLVAMLRVFIRCSSLLEYHPVSIELYHLMAMIIVLFPSHLYPLHMLSRLHRACVQY